MRRKLFGAILSCFIFAIGCGVFCACDQSTEHTVHSFGTPVEIAAECEKDGVRTYTCTYPGCGFEKIEPIPATGHVWSAPKVTEPATCEHGGKREKKCQICQKSVVEETAPVEHDWIPGESTADCEHDGTQTQSCPMCGQKKTVEIKALGHDWGDPEILKAATCEEAGIKRTTCRRPDCQKTVDDPLPKLDHQWTDTRVISEATCEKAGEKEQTCLRPGCGKSQTVPLPALDHNFSSEFTIDEPATFDHPGEKSYHCTRCGARNQVTAIPQLEENKRIEYVFRTVRNNGQLLFDSSIELIVKDGTGAEVARSGRTTLDKGVFRVDLFPKEYTVTVAAAPKGYTAEGTATVSPFYPVCNVRFTAAPMDGSVPSGTRYAVGSVMYDFTVPAANSTVDVGSLKEILGTKKMVLLNFWFVNCGYCEQEFPALQKAYEKYQHVAEVIAIDQGDNMQEIRSYGSQKGLKFPLVQDSAVGLISPFGVRSFPTSVVIDAEGVVCEIVIGASSQAVFENLFAKYTAEDYLKIPQAQTAQSEEEPVQYALPVRRKH